jgi:anti-anti-sigma factor
MSFTTEMRGTALVLRWSEEVAPDDATAIKDLIAAQPDSERIVIDLAGVALITTPGLGALVSIHKFCVEKKRRMRLCNLSPYVNEIFDLTRLSKVFEVVKTLEDALV